MYSRQVYLVSFLRGCADAADRGELGTELGRLLINGDLMREAADEFERLIADEKIPFKSFSDELMYNLVRAEQHTRQAHNMMYTRPGPTRSIWYKTVLGRAQKILAGLYKEEQQRKENGG
jgi:hypothetical protein